MHVLVLPALPRKNPATEHKALQHEGSGTRARRGRAQGPHNRETVKRDQKSEERGIQALPALASASHTCTGKARDGTQARFFCSATPHTHRLHSARAATGALPPCQRHGAPHIPAAVSLPLPRGAPPWRTSLPYTSVRVSHALPVLCFPHPLQLVLSRAHCKEKPPNSEHRNSYPSANLQPTSSQPAANLGRAP